MALCDILESYFSNEPVVTIAQDINEQLTDNERQQLIYRLVDAQDNTYLKQLKEYTDEKINDIHILSS